MARLPRGAGYAMPATTALESEQAGPNVQALPRNEVGASVVNYHGGAGDASYVPGVDEWQEINSRPVPHAGAMHGEQLRPINPPIVPPEGHGGFDLAGTDYGPFAQRSTQTQALFVSDWYGSTAANAGGGGSFRGDHVVIRRVRPGSDRGNMPLEMISPNTNRDLPPPWDAAITLGEAAL